MCDNLCVTGITITALVIGIITTMICCKVIGSYLNDGDEPDEPVVARTTQTRQTHTIVELPIIIRIYLPTQQEQQQEQQQSQQSQQEQQPQQPHQEQRVQQEQQSQGSESKNAFEPMSITRDVP
jgi:hypothetical protein